MLKTLSVLWLGSLLGAGAAFLTQVILARQLGPAAFGAFAAVLAAVTLVAPLAGFGVGGFWLKVFGKEGWNGLRWVRPSVVFSSLSTLCVMALILVWALLGPHDGNSTRLFTILSIYIVGQAIIEIASARFQLEERYTRLALWQLMPHALRLAGVGVLALYFGDQLSAEVVATTYAIVAVLLLSSGVLPIGQMFGGDLALKGHEDRPASLAIAKPTPGIAAVAHEAWPFGLAGVFYLIYFQSDIVLLKYLSGDEDAGFYNVAFVIIAAVYLFPSVVYQKYLLPKIHRWSHQDVPALHRVYLKGNRMMAISGLMAMAIVMVLAPFAIPLLFGPAFALSTTPLLILAFAIPVRFVATSVGAMLVTQDNMRRKVRYMGVVALINIVLNMLLIPYYKINGAAIATVSSEVVLLLIYWLSVKRFVFVNKGVA